MNVDISSFHLCKFDMKLQLSQMKFKKTCELKRTELKRNIRKIINKHHLIRFFVE